MLKVGAVTVAVVVAGIGILFGVSTLQRAPEPAAEPGTATVLRADTRRLDVAADGRVTVVEFLDFECEACGAYFPLVEQLREDYRGKVTFAYRYFPIPSHGNSTNAAVAVEAAARQGGLEPMYQRMFQTQAQWGEKGAQSQAPLFRTYAQELGLDMARYDADVASPKVLARVQRDFREGQQLGVDGTPTFFVNGRYLGTPAPEDLRKAIDDLLAS
ncbi:MAG: thioredoxin domain-containing protein [Micrococcales bacterium]|nr:thioredoxin domain-containing protein [Micrococcales bacterium]